MNTPYSSLTRTAVPRNFGYRALFGGLILFFLSLQQTPSIEPKEFPACVQETINALSQGASVTAAGSSIILGEPLFEAKISRDGIDRHWTLDANGVPLTVSISAREAPEPVQKTIQSQIAKSGALAEILRSYEEGKVVFEAVLRSAAGQMNYTIDAGGVIMSREIPLNQVPPKILKRASGVLRGAPPVHCYYSEENHEPYFTFSAAQPGGPRWVTLDANGDLSEEEEIVAADVLPESVKNAILQRLGNLEHVRVLQKKDEESKHFEVWAFNAGKLAIFWVSSTGDVSEVPPGN